MALCYLDKTFCKSDCTQTTCYRYYGEEQYSKALEWSKGLGLEYPLVALSDFSGCCEGYTPPNDT